LAAVIMNPLNLDINLLSESVKTVKLIVQIVKTNHELVNVKVKLSFHPSLF